MGAAAEVFPGAPTSPGRWKGLVWVASGGVWSPGHPLQEALLDRWSLWGTFLGPLLPLLVSPNQLHRYLPRSAHHSEVQLLYGTPAIHPPRLPWLPGTFGFPLSPWTLEPPAGFRGPFLAEPRCDPVPLALQPPWGTVSRASASLGGALASPGSAAPFFMLEVGSTVWVGFLLGWGFLWCLGTSWKRTAWSGSVERRVLVPLLPTRDPRRRSRLRTQPPQHPPFQG